MKTPKGTEDAIGLLRDTRKSLERAMLPVQEDVVFAEDGGQATASLRRIARSLRHAAFALRYAPSEVVVAVEVAANRDAGPERPPPAPPTLPPNGIDFADAEAKLVARRNAEKRGSL